MPARLRCFTGYSNSGSIRASRANVCTSRRSSFLRLSPLCFWRLPRQPHTTLYAARDYQRGCKAVSPLLGVASYRRAVKPLLTSVVREICTLRSVGAGERATAPGHPVGTGQLPNETTHCSLVAKAFLTLLGSLEDGTVSHHSHAFLPDCGASVTGTVHFRIGARQSHLSASQLVVECQKRSGTGREGG